MATTTPPGTPIPTLGDSPNVPADFLRFAQYIDPVSNPRFVDTAAANAAFPSRLAGQQAVINGVGKYWNGTAWVDVSEPKWAGIWVGAFTVPSDTTSRPIPMQAHTVSQAINSGAQNGAGRVVLPYTGTYAGFIRVSWPANTTGNRGQNTNPSYTNLNGGIFNAITNGSISQANVSPFQEHWSAGEAITVDVWQTSGVSASANCVLAMHLVCRD